MRTVDLWEYLPPILKDFLEMREILKTETPEFQALSDNLDDLAKDSFITEASVKGIARFEQMLKIFPSAGASLETRRSKILTEWWDVTPYTMRTLKNRIMVIQGNDNIEISFAEDDPYTIQIVTHLENPGQVDDLDYILQTMLPANLVIDCFNSIEMCSTINPVYGMGATMTETLFLTNDLDLNMGLEIPHKTGIGVGITNTLFLTNDLNETVELGITAHPAIGSGYTNFIEI